MDVNISYPHGFNSYHILPPAQNGSTSRADLHNHDLIVTFSNHSAQGSETNGTDGRNEKLAKIEIAIQAVILFLAVVGNSVVLIALALKNKKLSRMNILILHLSVADLFVAFFNVLPQLVWDITFRFYGGDILCRAVKYFQVVAMYASSYVLVSTAIDRYLAICHPLTSHTMTSKKVHAMVGIAWVLALLFSIPQTTIFAFRETAPGSGVYDCWGSFHPAWTLEFYVTWIFVAIYLIPVLILGLAYGLICSAVWRSMGSKQPSTKLLKTSKYSADNAENGKLLNEHTTMSSARKGFSKPRAHVRGLSNAKLKTFKLTFTVIICYVICWSPFFIFQMWAAWDTKAPFEDHAMVIALLLASLNSCTNPWIYLAFSDQLHTQLLRCFGVRHAGRRRTSSGFECDSRYKSSMMSQTEVTRFDESADFSNAIPLLTRQTGGTDFGDKCL